MFKTCLPYRIEAKDPCTQTRKQMGILRPGEEKWFIQSEFCFGMHSF